MVTLPPSTRNPAPTPEEWQDAARKLAEYTFAFCNAPDCCSCNALTPSEHLRLRSTIRRGGFDASMFYNKEKEAALPRLALAHNYSYDSSGFPVDRGLSPFPYHCPFCGNHFGANTFDAIERHVEATHSPQQVHISTDCPITGCGFSVAGGTSVAAQDLVRRHCCVCHGRPAEGFRPLTPSAVAKIALLRADIFALVDEAAASSAESAVRLRTAAVDDAIAASSTELSSTAALTPAGAAPPPSAIEGFLTGGLGLCASSVDPVEFHRLWRRVTAAPHDPVLLAALDQMIIALSAGSASPIHELVAAIVASLSLDGTAAAAAAAVAAERVHAAIVRLCDRVAFGYEPDDHRRVTTPSYRNIQYSFRLNLLRFQLVDASILTDSIVRSALERDRRQLSSRGLVIRSLMKQILALERDEANHLPSRRVGRRAQTATAAAAAAALTFEAMALLEGELASARQQLHSSGISTPSQTSFNAAAAHRATLVQARIASEARAMQEAEDRMDAHVSSTERSVSAAAAAGSAAAASSTAFAPHSYM